MVTREEFDKALEEMLKLRNYEKENNITKAFADYSSTIYSLIRIERDIAVYYYELRGVKGVNTAKDVGTFNEKAFNEKKLNLSESIQKLEQKKKEKIALINAFNVFLNALPNKEQKEYIYKVYVRYFKNLYDLTMEQLKDI